MTLKTIATGSSGNCHALISENEILLLDLGITAKEIKREIDYRISDVVGAVVTHRHGDHSKSVKSFDDMGMPVFKPYDGMESMLLKNCDFTIKAFDLTDKSGNWMHTNADGKECPCYGFLIEHPDMGKLLYITDTELVKWRFNGINHILISCNYQSKYIEESGAKRNHVLRGHMELETVKQFVMANKTNTLRNVMLCHMSEENADPMECVQEVKGVAGAGVNVDYARPGFEVELSEFPF